jgi:hypothetical protein
MMGFRRTAETRVVSPTSPRDSLNPRSKGPIEMNTTKERVADATAHVRPIVERAIRDEELRRNVKDAYTSARALYDQLLARNDIGQVATKIAKDEDVQSELRNVVNELRSAARRVKSQQEEEVKAARQARNGILLGVGIVVGLLVNPLTGPSLRRWLKGKMFGGSSKEFVYHEGNGTPLS